MNRLWSLMLLGVLGTAMVAPLAAQDVSGWDPRGTELKRAELDSLLARLNRAAQSSVYSEGLRRGALQQAKVVRERLQGGDFQPGDRILLRVEGETTLTDTFLVAAGPVVPLPPPVSHDISLGGVLRSELAPYLTGQIASYVRNPVVH